MKGKKEITATQKYARVSPRKLRAVADEVRGMGAQEASQVLGVIRKTAGKTLSKVIDSALAFARESGADPHSLSITELQILEGPRLKRHRAGARGRAKPYQRRWSHIRVVLAIRKSETLSTKSQTNSNNKKTKNEKK